MAIYFNNIQGDVASIFLSYFKRAPEFEAMQHYVGVLQALQANPETAGNAFNLLAAHIYADGVASQEVPAGPTVSDTWYVTYLYSNVLGRAADAEGLAYWVAELEAGNIARAELVGTFVAAALASEGRDAAYLNNRTEVAVEFAQWENSNPQVLPTLKYNAAEVLLGVNEDPATVAAAQSRLETTTGQVGETRNLTPAIDTIEGSTGNDTFNAVFSAGEGGASVATFTDFDSIDGDLGTDTFNIYVAPDNGANGIFPSNGAVRNVEIVNVYNGGSAAALVLGNEGAYLLNAANYQGVQQLWQVDSASDVINVGADTAVGFRNVDDLWSQSVGVAAGVSSATIVLENVDDAGWPGLEVYGSDLGAVAILGSLAAEAAYLYLEVGVGAGVTSVSVQTAVATDVEFYVANEDQPLINTVDFSGSTGDVDFWVDGSDVVAEGLTVTLGAGDDVVYFDMERTLSLRDVIDGGAGNDTLALEVNGKVQTQTYDAIALASNFENIEFEHGGGEDSVEIDANQLSGFETLVLWGASDFDDEAVPDFVVSNLSSDVTLEVADWAFAPMLAVADAPRFASVALDNADADVNVLINDTLAALLVGGDKYEDGAVTIPGSKGDTGGTLSLAGEGAVAYGNQSGKFSVIDAAALDGELMVVEMANAVAETITLGESTASRIELDMLEGAGSSSTLVRTDAIQGFALEGDFADELVITGEFYSGLAVARNLSSEGSLQEALAEAAAMYTGQSPAASAGDVVVFLFGGDTYVFGDTVSAGQGQYDAGDFLVKLVGFTDYTELATELTELPPS